MPAKNYVVDDFGRKLHAQLQMNLNGWHGYRLRFQSIPDVSTPAEFSEALDVFLGRLAHDKVLITDAFIMNPPNRRFPPAQRRLMISNDTYPIFAHPGDAASDIAFWLVYRAREIARERFLAESDFPHVSLDIRFRLPLYEIDTLIFLQQELKRMKAERDELPPPPEPPTVEYDREARGQGRLQDAVLRAIIEAYAMRLAIAHFEALGWHVVDVSAFEPFDLRCLQGTRELHVEVKGSTTACRSVMLTRNEVQHAREYPDAALFVVSNIEIVGANSARNACGGTVRLYQPWKIQAEDLEAQTYSLALRDK